MGAKKFIKGIIYFVFLLCIGLPLYVVYKSSFSSDKCFETISQLISLLPGYIGYFTRQAFYKLSINSGRSFDIGFGSTLVYPSVRIKNNVYIGANCQIAKCTIGRGVKIGSNVYVVNRDTHDIANDGTIIPTNVKKLKKVKIGEKTWIGNCSIIMADVGERCIIGAGSVVVKPIPDNSIAVGNPAKVIRENVR